MADKSLAFLLKQKSRKTVLSLVTLISLGLTPVFSISPSFGVNPKVISASNSDLAPKKVNMKTGG